jgi:hypothetical protein
MQKLRDTFDGDNGDDKCKQYENPNSGYVE